MSTLKDLVEVGSKETPRESVGEGDHNRPEIKSARTKACLRKQDTSSLEIRFKRA